MSRTRFRVMVLVFAASVITYLDRVCMSVAGPLMQKDLGLTQIQLSWIFSAFYFAYTIFEVPTAWMGDRWGQRRMMTRIVAWWSAFTILTGVAWSYSMLLVTRFLFGAGEAGAFPTLSRALARWFPPQERGRANGLMWTGARLGGAIAPPLAVAVIAWTGWRGSFWVFGSIGLIWCAVWWLWYRDDPADHPQVAPAELALIQSGSPAPAARPQRVPWRDLLLHPNMIGLFCSYFASGFGFQFFVTWLPTYFMREHGLTLGRSGWFASLPLASGAAGCLLGGLVADFLVRRVGLTWGRRSVAMGGFFLGAAGFYLAIQARSPEAAIASLILAAGAHDMVLPVMWSTCTDTGGRFGGTASGWMNLASSLSGMCAPMASAWLEQTYGSFHAVFVVTASVYVVGGLLWFLIDPRRPAVA